MESVVTSLLTCHLINGKLARCSIFTSQLERQIDELDPAVPRSLCIDWLLPWIILQSSWAAWDRPCCVPRVQRAFWPFSFGVLSPMCSTTRRRQRAWDLNGKRRRTAIQRNRWRWRIRKKRRRPADTRVSPPVSFYVYFPAYTLYLIFHPFPACITGGASFSWWEIDPAQPPFSIIPPFADRHIMAHTEQMKNISHKRIPCLCDGCGI